jgi:DUF1365 family protein
MASTAAPPAATSWLYAGSVMHRRSGAHANRFRYRHRFACIDLDDLDRLERRLRPWGIPLFGVRRRGLVRIDERDWMRSGDDPGRSLRDDVVAWARERDPEIGEVGRVQLVAMPRQLGYSFNPISLFYLTRAGSDRPEVVVVEVHNTFGEPHRYLAPVGTEPSHHDKRLHVSPFLPMQARYSMRIHAPGETFHARIDVEGLDAPFVATWNGRRRPLTTGQLLIAVAAMPLGALGVMARIHLQALRLWVVRRAPLYRKPPYEPGVGTISGPGQRPPREEHAP